MSYNGSQIMNFSQKQLVGTWTNTGNLHVVGVLSGDGSGLTGVAGGATNIVLSGYTSSYDPATRTITLTPE
jgi:hypothetical protein